MRWLATVVILVAALRAAAAKPALKNLDTLDYGEPCSQAKTWKRVIACHTKLGAVTTLYDTDLAKVISVVARGSDMARLHLYVPRDAGWGRSNLYAFLNKTTELLSITPYSTPAGNGIRLDLGMTMRSNISLDSTTSTRGLLRRVSSIVCSPSPWFCRSAITLCEAYVRGKVYWTYRGELIWDDRRGLRLRADTRNAGGACKPPSGLLVDSDGEDDE